MDGFDALSLDDCRLGSEGEAGKGANGTEGTVSESREPLDKRAGSGRTAVMDARAGIGTSSRHRRRGERERKRDDGVPQPAKSGEGGLREGERAPNQPFVSSAGVRDSSGCESGCESTVADCGSLPDCALGCEFATRSGCKLTVRGKYEYDNVQGTWCEREREQDGGTRAARSRLGVRIDGRDQCGEPKKRASDGHGGKL
eukprot:151620-Prorocentrum_minimum.AAC.1